MSRRDTSNVQVDPRQTGASGTMPPVAAAARGVPPSITPSQADIQSFLAVASAASDVVSLAHRQAQGLALPAAVPLSSVLGAPSGFAVSSSSIGGVHTGGVVSASLVSGPVISDPSAPPPPVRVISSARDAALVRLRNGRYLKRASARRD